MSFMTGKLPLDDEHALPLLGYVYIDASERRLIVQKVVARDPLGREVRGRVTDGFRERDYSTDLKTWAAIWRDKRPPGDPRAMKVGG